MFGVQLKSLLKPLPPNPTQNHKFKQNLDENHRYLIPFCKTKNCEILLNSKLFELCCSKPFNRFFSLCQCSHLGVQSFERETTWGETSKIAIL